MLAKHYIGKKMTDEVFETSQRAKAAILKYGKDVVINATLGALYDENGDLVVFDVVKDMYHTLPLSEFTAYAPHFTGSEQYKESVKKAILGEEYREEYQEFYISVIGTPGGTGAIASSVKNYLNRGDKVLLPKRMWGPYKGIALESGGSYDCYELFDEKGSFNLQSFEEKLMELASKQENVVVIINDPCHNPTGYKLTEEEWMNVMVILRSACASTNIILIKDIAYRDFDIQLYSQRKVLDNLPANLLCVYAFSLSKALGIYGMRVGAQMAISSNREIIEEFEAAAAFSCRTTWSNISRGGMEIFSLIMQSSSLHKNLLREQEEYRNLLEQRASIFMEEAERYELKVFPYRSGFFLTIPVGENVREIVKELEKQNIFTVIFDDAIRIAICGIPTIKLVGLAKKIKRTIENLKG